MVPRNTGLEASTPLEPRNRNLVDPNAASASMPFGGFPAPAFGSPVLLPNQAHNFPHNPVRCPTFGVPEYDHQMPQNVRALQVPQDRHTG